MHREEGERRVIDLFLGNLHECAHEDPRCRGAAGRKRGGACAGTACCVPSHQRPTAATWEVRTDDASRDAGEQGDGQYHPSGPMYSRPPIADGAVERGDHALAITLVLAHRRDEIPAGGSSHGRKAEHPPARGAKGRGEQVDPERRHQGEAGGEPASGEEHFRHEPRETGCPCRCEHQARQLGYRREPETKGSPRCRKVRLDPMPGGTAGNPFEKRPSEYEGHRSQ